MCRIGTRPHAREEFRCTFQTKSNETKSLNFQQNLVSFWIFPKVPTTASTENRTTVHVRVSQPSWPPRYWDPRRAYSFIKMNTSIRDSFWTTHKVWPVTGAAPSGNAPFCFVLLTDRKYLALFFACLEIAILRNMTNVVVTLWRG